MKHTPRLAALIVIIYSTLNHAALTSPTGPQPITVDTHTGWAWYTSMMDFDNLGIAQAKTAIATLNTGAGYAGYTNWHMATLSEMRILWTYTGADLASVFEPTYDTITYGYYDSLNTYNSHYIGSFDSQGKGPLQDYDYSYPDDGEPGISAFAVATKSMNQSTIPLPQAGLLASIGLGIVVMVRRPQSRHGV